MDIKFSCDKCGQHIVIDEAGAGLSVQCPNCSSSLIVPDSVKLQPTVLPRPVPDALGVEAIWRERVVESYTDFAFVGPRNFFGSFRDSLNGRFTVAWGNAGNGGYSRIYFLLQNRTVLLRGTRRNIQDAAVADNGNFLISDVSASEQGVVTIFDVTGKRLQQVRARFIYGVSIAPERGIANLEIPADWEKYPPGRITFNLLDGSVEVVKPCNRSPY